MAKNPLNRMLEDPEKERDLTSGANGILARLWRTILVDLNVNGIKFNTFLEAYIHDPRNGVPNERKDQTSARGNLTKELTRPQLTWRVLFKGLRFLQARRIKFTIDIEHNSGRITQHFTTVNLGDPVLARDLSLNDEDAAREGFVDPSAGIQWHVRAEVNSDHFYVCNRDTKTVYEDLGPRVNWIKYTTATQGLSAEDRRKLVEWQQIDPKAEIRKGLVMDDTSMYWYGNTPRIFTETKAEAANA